MVLEYDLRAIRSGPASCAGARRTGEAVENFLMRIRVAAGDLESVQAYVMDELRRVYGEA